jgi:hypothetical protein
VADAGELLSRMADPKKYLDEAESLYRAAAETPDPDRQRTIREIADFYVRLASQIATWRQEPENS